MHIVIRVMLEGPDFEHSNHYKSEMLRGFRLLADTLDSQVMNNKSYAVGEGTILNRAGQPFINYQIKP